MTTNWRKLTASELASMLGYPLYARRIVEGSHFELALSGEVYVRSIAAQTPGVPSPVMPLKVMPPLVSSEVRTPEGAE